MPLISVKRQEESKTSIQKNPFVDKLTKHIRVLIICALNKSNICPFALASGDVGHFRETKT